MFLHFVVLLIFIQRFKITIQEEIDYKEIYSSIDDYVTRKNEVNGSKLLSILLPRNQSTIFLNKQQTLNQNSSSCSCVINVCTCCVIYEQKGFLNKKVCIYLSNLKKDFTLQIGVVEYYIRKTVLFSGSINVVNTSSLCFQAYSWYKKNQEYCLIFPYLETIKDKRHTIDGFLDFILKSDIPQLVHTTNFGCFKLSNSRNEIEPIGPKASCKCEIDKCRCCSYIDDPKMRVCDQVCFKINSLDQDFSFLVELEGDIYKKVLLKKRILGVEKIAQCYQIMKNGTSYDYCFKFYEVKKTQHPKLEFEGKLMVKIRISKNAFISINFGHFHIEDTQGTAAEKNIFKFLFLKKKRNLNPKCSCKNYRCICCFNINFEDEIKKKYCLYLLNLQDNFSFLSELKDGVDSQNILLSESIKVGNELLSFCDIAYSKNEGKSSPYLYCIDFSHMVPNDTTAIMSGCVMFSIFRQNTYSSHQSSCFQLSKNLEILKQDKAETKFCLNPELTSKNISVKKYQKIIQGPCDKQKCVSCFNTTGLVNNNSEVCLSVVDLKSNYSYILEIRNSNAENESENLKLQDMVVEKASYKKCFTNNSTSINIKYCLQFYFFIEDYSIKLACSIFLMNGEEGDDIYKTGCFRITETF